MGPTWVLSAPGGPHEGPMNLAIRDVFKQMWDRISFAVSPSFKLRQSSNSECKIQKKTFLPKHNKAEAQQNKDDGINHHLSLRNKCRTADPDRQNLRRSGKLSFFVIYKFCQNCAAVRQVSNLILKTAILTKTMRDHNKTFYRNWLFGILSWWFNLILLFYFNIETLTRQGKLMHICVSKPGYH